MIKIKIIIAFLVGTVLGGGFTYYWFVEYPKTQWEVFTVASIKSHYPHPDDNSETNLSVYLEGDSGHVIDLLCLFPPEFSLEGGPVPSYAKMLLENKKSPKWTGIKKVRKKQKAKEYLFGQVGYFCEKVE